VCTIGVTLACAGWNEGCPAAESLARRAAELALARGVAASGLVWQGPVELSIVLADADRQQQLNRRYRGRDISTNVLAFPAWDPAEQAPSTAPILLGDVVLALEVVAAEASEQGKPIADHLGHMVVHGVLHLLGYDHDTQSQAQVMEALERSILHELGVPDPYRDPISFSEPISP
jgi:probable rRNA maturation factor